MKVSDVEFDAATPHESPNVRPGWSQVQRYALGRGSGHDERVIAVRIAIPADVAEHRVMPFRTKSTVKLHGGGVITSVPSSLVNRQYVHVNCRSTESTQPPYQVEDRLNLDP